MPKPNIKTFGRTLRALAGFGFVIAAPLIWPQSRLTAVLLAAIAAFLFYDAALGCCSVRVCGIRTPL